MFSKFEDLEIPPLLISSLTKMGFLSPTPIQAAAIPKALEGCDILGCAQTGTGKTGAFGVPLINTLIKNHGTTALVLAPTRELAEQIYKVMKHMSSECGLSGALVVGGASMSLQIQRVKTADIVVATPGRLIDLIRQRKINLSKVAMLVLDEADRMLDMGFEPQLRQILPHIPKQRQTLLFSATLPNEIMNLTKVYLNNPIKISVGEVAQPIEKIEQTVVKMRHDEKNDTLLKELVVREGKILVFARTQHRTKKLAKTLEEKGHQVDTLHGGRSSGQRRKALDSFRSGKCRILVATDLAGRGIDINDIEHVINYDMPATHDDYIHRIGRTGRNGKSGLALNFVTSEDEHVLKAGGPRVRYDKFDRYAPKKRRHNHKPRGQSQSPGKSQSRGQSQPRSQSRHF